MMVYGTCGNQRETSRDVEGWSLCEQYVAWKTLNEQIQNEMNKIVYSLKKQLN